MFAYNLKGVYGEIELRNFILANVSRWLCHGLKSERIWNEIIDGITANEVLLSLKA